MNAVRMVTFALLTGLLFSPALAGEKPAKGKPGPRGLWAEMDLNEEQKAELKKLKTEHHESARAAFAKVKAVREKVKAELEKEKPDPKALQAASKEAGLAAEELSNQRVDYLLRLKKVLTKEQFAKLLSKEWVAAGHDGHWGRGKHRGPPGKKKGPPPKSDAE